MTNRENEILSLIKEDPLISQIELARKLNITRSSVGVHISSLINKGYIKGKGYILNEENTVSVIGACNIDILGSPVETMLGNDSCPGKISYHFGGVGRNISENLVKLGIKTSLFSILGKDKYGDEIFSYSNELGMDTSNIKKSSNYGTSTYLSILGNNGDVICALSDMDIVKEIDVDYFKKNILRINKSNIVVIDTNLNLESLEFLFENISGDVFIDTVSTAKCTKISGFENKIFLLKPNIIEAEKLLKRSIEGEDEIFRAMETFIKKGIKNVIITCGKDGIYYSDAKNRGKIISEDIEIINANGAGDSFMAGLVYGFSKKMTLEESCQYGYLASIITLKSEKTISENMTTINLETLKNSNILKNLKKV